MKRNALYIENCINRNKNVPVNARKIEKLAKKTFGEANVSLEVGFDNYARMSCENYLNAVVRNYANPTMRMRRNQIKKLSTGNWNRLSLLIHVPKETVTNETGDSTEIYDLFVRIPLTNSAKLAYKFEYLRTTFTKNQWRAGYVHSHCPSLDKSNVWNFEGVCTGHDGENTPINYTIVKLKTEEFSPITWRCFFWELKKVISRESLRGVPYKHLKESKGGDLKLAQITYPTPYPVMQHIYRPPMMQLIQKFIKENSMDFTVQNCQITIPYSFAEWLIKFTNFCNTKCDIPILPRKDYVVFNDKVYESNPVENPNVQKVKIIRFRGIDYSLKILKEEEYSTTKLINVGFAAAILNFILSIANCTIGSNLKKQLNEDEYHCYSTRTTFESSESPARFKTIVAG